MFEIKVVRNDILNNIDLHDQTFRMYSSPPKIRQIISDSKNAKIWQIWHRYFRFDHSVLVEIKVVKLIEILNGLWSKDVSRIEFNRRNWIEEKIRRCFFFAFYRRNWIPPARCLAKGIDTTGRRAAVRETGISRWDGSTIDGSPETPAYHSTMLHRGSRGP